MMDGSPRAPYVPVPTPKVKPGDTIVISNAPTPVPVDPTIIISNAPKTAAELTPGAAAAQGLVWVNAQFRTYHRPGSRYYGTTVGGFYTTRAQAELRGNRASRR